MALHVSSQRLGLLERPRESLQRAHLHISEFMHHDCNTHAFTKLRIGSCWRGRYADPSRALLLALSSSLHTKLALRCRANMAHIKQSRPDSGGGGGHLHIHTYTYTHTNTHTHIQIHTHTPYTHTFTHKHTHTLTFPAFTERTMSPTCRPDMCPRPPGTTCVT